MSAIVELFRTLHFETDQTTTTRIRVFGTKDKPLFLANEIARICVIPERTWQIQIKGFPGK